MEWGVQNGPFTKNGVLPVINLFFLKILFQFKNLLYRVDLLHQQPRCSYLSFCKRRSFIWRSFFPVSILKQSCWRRLKKKGSNTVFFKNTSGRLLWKLSCFFLILLYTHSRKNWNFSRKVYFSNNWGFFAAHVWFYTIEANACWWVQQQDETTIKLSKYSCKPLQLY